MGRPRSALAHKKVLNAAVELFSERGIDATSMDAIAETAGVSKATIYKHWPDKDSLCLEVMGNLHGLDEKRPRLMAWLQRIHARPAYLRAVERGGKYDLLR